MADEGVRKYCFMMVTFRAFSKLYHSPFSAAVDSVILIFYPSDPYLLLAASFGINRLLIFIRKVDYYMVSLLTAMKNKK